MNAKQLRKIAIDTPHGVYAHAVGLVHHAFWGSNVEARVHVADNGRIISTRYSIYGNDCSAASVDKNIAENAI